MYILVELNQLVLIFVFCMISTCTKYQNTEPLVFKCHKKYLKSERGRGGGGEERPISVYRVHVYIYRGRERERELDRERERESELERER